LLLDEPTNDLDTDTLAELEDLLDSWAGTLVVVSHDRYLIERVCDSIVAIVPAEGTASGGSLAALPGGVEQYLARRAASGAVDTAKRRERKGDSRSAHKELARLERQIAKLGKREKSLLARLVEQATDFERVAELDAELRRAVSERTAAEDAWLSLSDDA
jgi:ABC transport system ATP-binding/permease protein